MKRSVRIIAAVYAVAVAVLMIFPPKQISARGSTYSPTAHTPHLLWGGELFIGIDVPHLAIELGGLSLIAFAAGVAAGGWRAAEGDAVSDDAAS